MYKEYRLYFGVIILTMLSPLVSAWTINANFDNGTLGEKAERSPDAFAGAAGRSTYTNEQKLKGQAVKLQAKAGDTGFGNWGGEFFYPRIGKGDKIWYLIHTYIPQDFDHYSYGEGNRLKFLRIHTFTADDKNVGYIDIYFDMKTASNPFAFIYEGEHRWSLIGGAADYPVKDTWESYEFAVTLDSKSVDDGGLAEIRFWKNGILLKHITDRITLKFDDGYSNRALLFTYWNGGSPKDQHMYADEITITNETPNQRDQDGYPYLKGLIDQRPVMLVD